MFAAFVFAIMLSKDVPKRFFPDSDRPQILVYTQLPAGTSQREMTRQMKGVFERLMIKSYFLILSHFQDMLDLAALVLSYHLHLKMLQIIWALLSSI